MQFPYPEFETVQSSHDGNGVSKLVASEVRVTACATKDGVAVSISRAGDFVIASLTPVEARHFATCLNIAAAEFEKEAAS